MDRVMCYTSGSQFRFLRLAWAGSIQPHHPRCEYRVDPLGIDELKPRLSWELRAADSSARDLRQTACRILAARGREGLEAG